VDIRLPFRVIAAIALVGVAQCQAEGADSEQVRFSRLGAAHGMRQYMPNAWGVVGVDIVNPRDEPVEVVATFTCAKNSAEQFARQIWTPPHSVRRTWVPIRIPHIPSYQGQVEISGLLIDKSSGSEVVLRRGGEMVQHATPLSINRDVPIAGIIPARDGTEESEGTDYPYEALIALQGSKGLGRRVVIIGDRYLPALPEALDGLDQLVLYNDRFAKNVAAMAAIRAWLNDGGNLWIMLDRVDFDGVERLLGETFACEMVDRVELNEVEIQPVVQARDNRPAAAAQYEQPVDFVRVVVSDMDVTHTVNNWPAAFCRNVGRGRVVFTTVGAKAWLERRGSARGGRKPKGSTDFVPIAELEELPILLRRRQMSLESKELVPYLSEQIGYRIVSRTHVFAILGAFCAGLSLVGLFLAKVRRLEYMGWIAPIAAVATAAPVLLLGVQSTQTVPPTIGQMQIVEVSDVADRITATGVMALYRPSTATTLLGAGEGGVLVPDASAVHGATRRMVWTDLNRWYWESLRLPAGVQTAPFRRSATLAEPVEARGTFTSAGFEGRLTGSIESPSDAVIAIPGQPRLAVTIEGNAVIASSEDLLARRQYIAGGLLTDEQGRRQSIYRQLIRETRTDESLLTRPTMFAWSRPVDMQFELPSDARQLGSALWSIPLRIEPPEPGTRVVVPSPFVRYRPVRGTHGEGISALFDYRTGEWINAKLDSRTWLRFSVPQEILPISLDRARMTIDLNAPGRKLEIVCLTNGQNTTLFTKDNPIGRIQTDITDPSVLEVDETGGFRLGIFVVGLVDIPKNEQKANWKIDSLQLEVAGRAL